MSGTAEKGVYVCNAICYWSHDKDYFSNVIDYYTYSNSKCLYFFPSLSVIKPSVVWSEEQMCSIQVYQ